MNRIRTRFITSVQVGVGVGFVLASVALFQGCSSSETETPGGGATKQPPKRPSGPTTTETATKTFAVKQLFLGDAPRSGPPTNTAWKKFGYDLDGKISTKDSTDVCKLPPGGDKVYKEDGDQGIDNSFGHNLISLITSLSPSAATDLNASITDGNFTLMFSVTGLSDDAKQTATGLKGYLNAGGLYDPTGQTKPSFSPSEQWPVRQELLNGSDPASSRIQFADAYVVDGTFVSGGSAQFALTLGFSGQTLDLTIYKPIVTFDHSAPSAASNGIIAGIIKTEELINGLTKIAGRFNSKFCKQEELATIVESIRSVSDIMSDGTQDPSKTCDGVSIGLGFEATQIANPTKVADPTPPGPDLCSGAPADGGTDTGTADTGTPDGGVVADTGTD